MATTSVHSIYVTQTQALEYIVNPEKTEDGTLVQNFACSNDPVIAAEMFDAVRNEKGTGRGIILARHIHQNFAPGETTPEEAMQIGLELCQKLFGNEYQFVIATHTDKQHIHNHIIVNNVNLENGRTLNYLADRGKQNLLYQKIRDTSDMLCREHQLSVVENPELGKKQRWYEWSQEKQGLSWKSKLRYELDCLIMRSDSFEDFIDKCRANNIEVDYNPNRKIDLKFRMPEQQKFARAKTLGWYYETSQIKKRIENYLRHKELSLAYQPRTKIIDTSAELFQEAKGLEQWADIRNMQEASRVIDILTQYQIESTKEVKPAAISASMHRAKLVEELNHLQKDIASISETIEALRVFQKYRPIIQQMKNLPDRKKKGLAEKFSNELEKYREAGTKLKAAYPDGKVPSEENLIKKRNEMIQQRDKSNSEYKAVNSELKDIDYARQAIDDYLKTQDVSQEQKRKKGDLE